MEDLKCSVSVHYKVTRFYKDSDFMQRGQEPSLHVPPEIFRKFGNRHTNCPQKLIKSLSTTFFSPWGQMGVGGGGKSLSAALHCFLPSAPKPHVTQILVAQ